MNDDYARRFQMGNPFHTLLGVELVRRGEGHARCRLPVTDKVRGGVAGSVHGGVLSALVDIVTLSAISTVVDPAEDQMAGTAELNISFLRPALGEAVYADARVLKKGRQLAVVDVDLTDADGRLVAKGRVNYALRSLRPTSSPSA
jgi:acyl-CoA thioesterase